MSQEQNIFVMKQPELGQTIARLRQSKGLTQEELVEKCNISIRTIQRIEAGDVTPRSYTIKALFSALDYEYSAKKEEESTHTNESITFHLYLSIIAGIIYFIVGIPEGYMDFLRFDDLDPDIKPLFYALVKSISAGSLVVFIRGFWLIGKSCNISILQYGTIALMTVMVFNNMLDIATLLKKSWDTEEMFMFQIILLSIGIVFFGASLIMSRATTGDLSLIAGITELFIAATLITVILGFISLILSIFSTIFEIIILYQVAKRLQRESREYAHL